MSGTWTIDDIQGIFQVVGAVAVIVAGAVGYGALRQQNTEQGRKIESNRLRVEDLAKNLQDFREKIAVEYVNRDSLRELEDRLVGAIERLGDRFDKYFDRKF